jgi:diaminohydroxyphosphoribosylaminopyrimidine deaminase/5-amino-6-(5-phosphoribosylamino)uracil reductase
VLADDPSLTVRWDELSSETQQIYPRDSLRQPLRIILDSQNRVTPQHRVVQQPGMTWLARQQPDDRVWPAGVEQLSFPLHGGGIDLVVMMMQLAKRQVNSIWVEAGAQLAGALLQAGLVDELVLYIAPKLLGDNARGLCQLPGLTHLADAPEFVFSEVRQIGPDLRLRLTAK